VSLIGGCHIEGLYILYDVNKVTRSRQAQHSIPLAQNSCFSASVTRDVSSNLKRSH